MSKIETELDLYKYLFDEDKSLPELRWHDDELLVFIHFAWLEDFIKTVIPDGYFDDGPLSVYMNDGYIVLDLADICRNQGIEPENIVPKGESRNG